MADFDALLATHDPDRRLAALFAPPELRARLFALYAFHHEIAKIPDSVSEPVIGEMRLAWVREAVEDLYADPPKVRRHDVYEALAGVIAAPGGPAKSDLIGLVEARGADLGRGPFPDADERAAYVDRTAGLIMSIAARLACPGLDFGAGTGEAVRAAGRVWGYAGLLRAFPGLAAAGRPPLTADEMGAAGLSAAQAEKGLNPDGARAALAGLRDEAVKARETLTATRKALPAEIFPVIGYAALATGYLRRADQPYQPGAEPALAVRQARLVWASLRGRV